MRTLRRLNTFKYWRWYLYERKKLLKFKDIHAGEDCFIIGNGPSLNNMDLSKLANYHTFGLNKIYLMEERGIDLNLSYLVSANKFVMEQSADKFAQLSCPVFLSYRNKQTEANLNKEFYYFLSWGERDFSQSIYNPINEGGTVTYVALQIAFFMGFKRVFLIGVDHSFKQKGKPNETQHLAEDDANHFDPNYFKGQNWQLADLDRSEESYMFAKNAFEESERKIFDATLNGHLEIFDKIDYQEALEIMKRK